MKTLFAPGCALNRYKPELIARLSRFLMEKGLADGVYETCCKSDERLQEKTALITCCPGCSHKFGLIYPESDLVSLWKVLLDTDFPFPDYHGERMTIHDACPARHRNSPEMQSSARQLCARMNIRLIEPEHTRGEAGCCGGSAGDYETRRRMACARARELPEKNVGRRLPAICWICCLRSRRRDCIRRRTDAGACMSTAPAGARREI